MTPKIRQTAYHLGAIATSIVTILALWHGIDGGTATALGNTITAILGLLGVGATGVAATTVARQRKDGTLDFTGSAAEQAVAAISATVGQAQAAAADFNKVTNAVAGMLPAIPAAVTGLAAQVIDAARRG